MNFKKQRYTRHLNPVTLLCLISALAAACNESENNGPAFSIYAQPQRVHAPGNVLFNVESDESPEPTNCSTLWDFGDGVTLSGLDNCNHTYKDPGNYNVTATIACDQGTTVKTQAVEVYPTADLLVTAVDARPLEITTGSTLQAQFQLTNTKNAVRIGTSIELFLVPSNNPSEFIRQDDTRIYQYALPDFPGENEEGSAKTFSFDVPVTSKIPTGSYFLAVYADPDNLVGESDENNNLAFSNATILIRNQGTDGADLIASSLNISPLSTRILSSFTADFEILNNGSTAAIDFDYQIWIGQKGNDKDRENATLLTSGSLPGAVSGESTMVKDLPIQVSPAIDEPGFYYLWLVLDPDNSLFEKDETNNVVRSASPITITDDPILDADIIIKDLSFTPEIAYQLGSFNSHLTLFNQGSQPTGSFICSIYLSEDQTLQPETDFLVSTLNVSDLPANTEQKFNSIAEIPSSIHEGKYWVYTYCDSSGVVVEANEDNNTQRSNTQITVVSDANVDLAISDFNLTSAQPLPSGSNLSFSASVCNTGLTGAGPSTFTVNLKNLCNNSLRELKRFTIDSINSNQCQKIQFNEPLSCDFWCDQYELSLNADALDVVIETNENNNTATLEGSLNITGDSCACTVDKCEQNNSLASACSLQSGTHEMTLCNTDTDWFSFTIPENQSFEAKVSHISARSKLKASLWSASEELASRHGTDDLYLASYLSPSNRTLFIHVEPEEKTGANSYTLDVQIYGQNDGQDLAIGDLRIENDALSATDSRTVTYKLYDLGKTPVTQSFNVVFYASTDANIDKNAIRLGQRTYTSLNGKQTLEDNISLKLPNEIGSGNWQLIAHADEDDTLTESNKTNNYARSTSWLIERNCWDSLDPNDQQSNAAEIEFQTINGTLTYAQDELRVCKTNPDFYQITIPSGYDLDITAKLISGTGDFDINLYDETGTLVDTSATAQSIEKIHRDIVLGNQTLYIEIFQLKNDYNPDESLYTLEITSKPVNDYLLCDDSFEPNNHKLAAYPLLDAAFNARETAICPSYDEDYYVISLTEGRRLQLKCKTTSTNLRAALYDPEGTLAGMLSNPVSQSFDYTAPVEGNYILRVYTNTPDVYSQTYSLELTGFGSDDIAVSQLAVSPNAPTAGDTIQVSFNVVNNGEHAIDDYQYTIYIENNGQQTELDSQAIKKTLAPSASHAYAVKVDLPQQTPSSAALKVNVTSDKITDTYQQNNTASVNLNVTPACLNDAFEPNNYIQIATPLQGSVTARICDNDDDWYQWNPSKSGNADVTLSFKNNDGDLDLYIYDKDMTLLASSRTTSDEEKASLSVTYGKSYYILVKSFDGKVRNNYSLKTSL